MLFEGHATWVQERVAAELGLAESAQRFAAQMLSKHKQEAVSDPDDEGDANMRGYLDGKKFVEAVYAKGGVKAVQDLFVNPPKSTHLIEDPDVFLAQQEAKKKKEAKAAEEARGSVEKPAVKTATPPAVVPASGPETPPAVINGAGEPPKRDPEPPAEPAGEGQ